MGRERRSYQGPGLFIQNYFKMYDSKREGIIFMLHSYLPFLLIIHEISQHFSKEAPFGTAQQSSATRGPVWVRCSRAKFAAASLVSLMKWYEIAGQLLHTCTSVFPRNYSKTTYESYLRFSVVRCVLRVMVPLGPKIKAGRCRCMF